MAHAPAIPSGHVVVEHEKDVWTRSGPRYRVRAVLLLIVNVLLFAGLGAFALWLREGQPFPWLLENYADNLSATFRFTGDMQVSLSSFLVGPMSVQDVPILLPIVGLLLASLVMIPILVAILYRFWACIPFIAVVGFVAVMPWLAMTLILSCVLASVRPFRLRQRVFSALLGLVPVAIYLVMASRGAGAHVGNVADPMGPIKYATPWLFTIVSAAVIATVVLLIARLVDYRPGAIAPVMAVMFALPVLLFEFYVGRDELYYRLLEREQNLFTDVSAADVLERRAEETWLELPEQRRVDFQVWRAFREIMFKLNLMTDDPLTWTSWLTDQQQRLVQHCDTFVLQFPDSPYACNALYIKGSALSTRVNLREFSRTKWIRYRDDYPHKASWTAWRMIVENCPGSDTAAVALLRLAQLDARDGNPRLALEQLDRLIEEFSNRPPAPPKSRAEGLSAILTPPGRTASLNISLDAVLLEAHRLRDLLSSNNDPIYGYAPLVGGGSEASSSPQLGLLKLIPYEDRYEMNLRRLIEQYPRAQILDNVELELARIADTAEQRMARLTEFVDTYRDGDSDALPEAMYRLAVLLQDANRREEAQAFFCRLLNRHAGTIWAQQARRFATTPCAE